MKKTSAKSCGKSARKSACATPAKPSATSAPQTTPQEGFSYSRAFFEGLVDSAIAHAKKLGASDAGAEASEGCGLSVSVRMGELENVERNRDKSLGVTVYIGRESLWRANWSTAQDPFAALPDEGDIYAGTAPALDLFHPWSVDSAQAAQLALQCEAAALQRNSRISNSDGASVSAQQSHFFSAHTHGFRGGYASSRHSIGVAPIAGTGEDMQRDYWYSSMRAAEDLADPVRIGQYAADRALSRLGARKIPTTECPVLFETPLAAGLLGAFVQATSGGALYRKSSFLLNSLGKQVFPKHIQISEDPFVLRGKGSSPFDAEGVQVRPRQVVQDGKVQGYFLSSYTARKLGMPTTGNSGGSHNLVLSSSQTRAADDLEAMLQKLGTGLFVIELMGQGVNYVTGDYSRGASGFWVENGQIAYPVQEITIAGNMRDMFKNIAAVGADAYTMGAKTVGSVLIKRMKVAGN